MNTQQRKPRRLSTIDQAEVRDKYPQVAIAFEQLLKENRALHNKFYVAYTGKYRNKESGAIRRTTLGAILETLEAFDYRITIECTKAAIN